MAHGETWGSFWTGVVSCGKQQKVKGFAKAGAPSVQGVLSAAFCRIPAATLPQ